MRVESVLPGGNKLMSPDGTLLLTRSDVASVLTIEDCTVAVERAFRMHGEGKTQPPGVLGPRITGMKSGRVFIESFSLPLA